MKKYFLAFTATAISTLACNIVHAQNLIAGGKSADFKNLTAYVSFNDDKPEIKNDKSTLYKINFKAVQHFKTTYPDITCERWVKLRDEGYLASFVSNSAYIRNYYDKKGNWLHSLQRYDETKLPDDVRLLLRETFAAYSITAIEEASTNRNNREPIYLIYIQQDKEHKTIRVCDGEIEEVKL